MPRRDLTKTLPGTGPTPLVDGDVVAVVLRDLALGVDDLGKSLHAKLDKLTPPDAPDAPETPSQPPAATKGQKAAAGAVNLGKYAGLFVIAAIVARALEHKYPGAADAIEAVLKSLNL
ncbi:MAG TPA: hypothetical protein VIU86_19990 [Gaiellaceae bacterium]